MTSNGTCSSGEILLPTPTITERRICFGTLVDDSFMNSENFSTLSVSYSYKSGWLISDGFCLTSLMGIMARIKPLLGLDKLLSEPENRLISGVRTSAPTALSKAMY